MEIKVVLGFKKASSSNRKNEIQKEIKGIERGMVDYAPGMRIIIRDTELRVTKVLPKSGKRFGGLGDSNIC
mgnify:CR=1 FL=1